MFGWKSLVESSKSLVESSKTTLVESSKIIVENSKQVESLVSELFFVTKTQVIEASVTKLVDIGGEEPVTRESILVHFREESTRLASFGGRWPREKKN